MKLSQKVSASEFTFEKKPTKAKAQRRETINLRLAMNERQQLTRAAALSNVSVSELIRSSVARTSEEIIQRHSTITFSGDDYDALIDMLDETVPVSPQMREAANRVDNGREDMDEIRAALKKPLTK